MHLLIHWHYSAPCLPTLYSVRLRTNYNRYIIRQFRSTRSVSKQGSVSFFQVDVWCLIYARTERISSTPYEKSRTQGWWLSSQCSSYQLEALENINSEINMTQFSMNLAPTKMFMGNQDFYKTKNIIWKNYCRYCKVKYCNQNSVEWSRKLSVKYLSYLSYLSTNYCICHLFVMFVDLQSGCSIGFCFGIFDSFNWIHADSVIQSNFAH